MAKHVCRIYRMNVYSMNVIRTYYIHHVVIYCHSFTNPLPWPHGIVKHPSYAHFRMWPEEVSHTGTLLWVLWIQTYLLPHTDFAYYIVGKYVISDAATPFTSESLNHSFNDNNSFRNKQVFMSQNNSFKIVKSTVV